MHVSSWPFCSNAFQVVIYVNVDTGRTGCACRHTFCTDLIKIWCEWHLDTCNFHAITCLRPRANMGKSGMVTANMVIEDTVIANMVIENMVIKNMAVAKLVLANMCIANMYMTP